MNIDWRGLVRHYLMVVPFCAAVAALTSAIWQRNYLEQLGYALCIGTPTWAFIETGRLILRRPTDPSGWPRGGRGLLMVIAGIALGFYFGSWLGDALFDIDQLATPNDRQLSVIVSVIAGVVATWFFYTRSERVALAARINAAERDAAEARLTLLAAQLEPHMLFNTLANLRALIAVDVPRAVEMLDHLNSYLRVTLTGSRATAHPLASEFERLRDYLALMAVRMGPRLRYTLDLPDDLREQPIPPLLLQPLVENGIRHGLEPKVEGGEINVRVRRDDLAEDGVPRIRIEIRDTGTGLGAVPASCAGGFGIEQVRERLAVAYGERGTLKLEDAPDGGAVAIITFPSLK
ncbi:MAG: histidine kinase [Burkholderiaceae bacterium]|jgi:LytS/YehU family sensor histidine kinase|nr:histidine kinase [Burkholderiaceae bacterium]